MLPTTWCSPCAGASPSHYSRVAMPPFSMLHLHPMHWGCKATTHLKTGHRHFCSHIRIFMALNFNYATSAAELVKYLWKEKGESLFPWLVYNVTDISLGTLYLYITAELKHKISSPVVQRLLTLILIVWKSAELEHLSFLQGGGALRFAEKVITHTHTHTLSSKHSSFHLHFFMFSKAIAATGHIE